jgi:hypothetical protein
MQLILMFAACGNESAPTIDSDTVGVHARSIIDGRW